MIAIRKNQSPSTIYIYHITKHLIMETFLLQNAARHQQLVKQFKPKTRAVSEDTASNSSIEVATRIRPILAGEAASGQVPAAFPRPGESGVVDLHELRRVVRGPPPLNVSALYSIYTAFVIYTITL